MDKKLRLYGEYDSINEAGAELEKSTLLALYPIIDQYQKVGYSLREIRAVIEDVVMDMILNKMAGWDEPPQ